MPDDALIVDFPVLIKSSVDKDGRRMMEVEASSEVVDSEGDVILQKALLGSAKSFVKSGHIDIDHLSELGDRLGIPNPESFIIGHPKEVKDLGEGRTGVVAEIMRSRDGKFDSAKNRYDSFWESLQSDPPVRWRASIYGFPLPGEVDDCRKAACSGDATRFLVKGMDWRSLAMTRNPINTSLTGYARIVTAKSWVAERIMKGGMTGMPNQVMPAVGMSDTMPPPMMPMSLPMNMDTLAGQFERHIDKSCMFTKGGHSREAFKDHFVNCCGAPHELAEILAHALMYHEILRKRRVA